MEYYIDTIDFLTISFKNPYILSILIVEALLITVSPTIHLDKLMHCKKQFATFQVILIKKKRCFVLCYPFLKKVFF